MCGTILAQRPAAILTSISLGSIAFFGTILTFVIGNTLIAGAGFAGAASGRNEYSVHTGNDSIVDARCLLRRQTFDALVIFTIPCRTLRDDVFSILALLEGIVLARNRRTGTFNTRNTRVVLTGCTCWTCRRLVLEGHTGLQRRSAFAFLVSICRAFLGISTGSGTDITGNSGKDCRKLNAGHGIRRIELVVPDTIDKAVARHGLDILKSPVRFGNIRKCLFGHAGINIEITAELVGICARKHGCAFNTAQHIVGSEFCVLRNDAFGDACLDSPPGFIAHRILVHILECRRLGIDRGEPKCTGNKHGSLNALSAAVRAKQGSAGFTAAPLGDIFIIKRLGSTQSPVICRHIVKNVARRIDLCGLADVTRFRRNLESKVHGNRTSRNILAVSLAIHIKPG